MTIDDFTKALQSLNRSAHTLKNYRRDLQSFLAFWQVSYCQDTEMPSNDFIEAFDQWSNIQTTHIKDYLAYRSQQGVHPRTLSRELSSLRSALNFFLENGVVSRNVAKSVKAPKLPAPLPKSLDVDQTTKLLSIGEQENSIKASNNDAPQMDNWQNIRDQAIFELLYSGGLRVSECAQLDVIAVAQGVDSGWVKVFGKGSKERLAPMGSKAKSAIKVWLSIRALHAKPDEQALFVNRYGNRLGVRSIQASLDKRAQQAGLPTKVSPHRLRHACATHVLESSGDLRAVQEMLGHANLSTTQIYTKLDLQHLAKVYDSAHPRAKK
ncbi:tyrosine-type recombinase/integrase [Thiomicrorhabdus indica]|uniref:tyrosine-type recombinase/integrase n=1 Tax=Thiomicrorhabdus indica TaxID=2267253 RepID=UPI002AA6780F|nr:tyrosine-type recombinase/integrase [Thiomicrorhabdus indica]